MFRRFPGAGLPGGRIARTLVLCALAGSVAAAESPSAALTDLSLEELLKVEITSVARKGQKLYDSAAAAFVITQDDIRRSGATSVPEALRMAPGVQVARYGPNKWAITARGHNGRFANKLLVLLDGRSVYTPLFSGVVWEANDTVLENIERIEVIRGPGAAMWGANAVNGVINIITRATKDTQGTQVTAWAGTIERNGATVRHGGKLGAEGHYRIYAKTFDLDHGVDAAGNANPDSMRGRRAGFRADLPAGRGQLMLSGEAHGEGAGDAVSQPTLVPPYAAQQIVRQKTAGFHVLGRWTGDLADGSALTLQGYVDHATIDFPTFVGETRDTVDVEMQHRLRPLGRHEVHWGLGLRASRDRIENRGITFTETGRTAHLLSAFVNDDVELLPETLRLTLAGRLEHNSYTGFEFQPTARLLWTPSPEQSVWTALSRAVRTPSRVEDGFRLNSATLPPNTASNPSGLPALVGIVSTSGTFVSEEVTSFELGLRRQLSPTTNLDIATFANHYRKLRDTRMAAPVVELTPLPPHLFIALENVNGPSATTHGLEVAFDWRPVPWLRLQPAYTYMRIQPSSTAPGSTGAQLDGSYPQQQLSLRSSLNLGERHQLDFWLRYVDALPTIPAPSYATLDIRYAWKPARGYEFALVGQNLLDGRHPEYVSDFIASASSQVQRGLYVKGRIEF